MILGKEHLPIWIPSEQHLADLVESRAPVIRQLYLDTDVLVLETLPNVECSVDTDDAMIGYGAHQCAYDGWGMAALDAYTTRASLVFTRGVDLEDADGLLEGTGKKMRQVQLRSLKACGERREALVRMIEAAARLAEE